MTSAPGPPNPAGVGAGPFSRRSRRRVVEVAVSPDRPRRDLFAHRPSPAPGPRLGRFVRHRGRSFTIVVAPLLRDSDGLDLAYGHLEARRADTSAGKSEHVCGQVRTRLRASPNTSAGKSEHVCGQVRTRLRASPNTSAGKSEPIIKYVCGAFGHGGLRRLRFLNAVKRGRYPRLTVPVGPLRCFATMISAIPPFSLPGL